MIAKKNTLIISGLKNSSLQSSLQKQPVNRFCILHKEENFSLQKQEKSSSYCKENMFDIELIMKNSMLGFFAKNNSLHLNR